MSLTDLVKDFNKGLEFVNIVTKGSKTYDTCELKFVDKRLLYKNKQFELFRKAHEYVTCNLDHQSNSLVIKEVLEKWLTMIIEEITNYHFNNSYVIDRFLRYNNVDKTMQNIRELFEIPDVDLDIDEKNTIIELLALAFTPSSSSSKLNNEVLEFIGDKIINKCIADYLFNLMPYSESRLTHTVFRYNDKKFFSEIARTMGIDKFLHWDMKLNTESTSEDAFEAFIKVLDLTSKYLNKKLLFKTDKININIDLVEMFVKYIMDNIIIEDVIKPDITFITELFNNCSRNTDKLVEHISYSNKDDVRCTYLWFTCKDETIENIIKYMHINKYYTDKIENLFRQKYVLNYTERKIAKSIACKYIVKGLAECGLDIVKFTNIKSEVILRNNIKKFCNKNIDLAKKKCKELVDIILKSNNIYLDVVDSKYIDNIKLKIKIVPINMQDIKIYIHQDVILKTKTADDTLINIIDTITNKLKEMLNNY